MKKNALSFLFISACIAGPIGLSAQKTTSAPEAVVKNLQPKIAGQKENESFVGMHPIPVLHGMTIGEYAL